MGGGGGTGQGVSRGGSFSLLKEIAPFSEKFPEDTEFTVKVEEFAPPGQDPATDAPPVSSYEIKVKADGTPVSGINPPAEPAGRSACPRSTSRPLTVCTSREGRSARRRV